MADDMNPRGAPDGAEPDAHTRRVTTGEAADELYMTIGRRVIEQLQSGERHVLVSRLDDGPAGEERYVLNSVDAFISMDPARPANN